MRDWPFFINTPVFCGVHQAIARRRMLNKAKNELVAWELQAATGVKK
jgi:hypothetical protein